MLGGLVHPDPSQACGKVFNPITAVLSRSSLKWCKSLIILAIARPYEDAVRLVNSYCCIVVVTNTVGAALFMPLYCSINARCLKNATRHCAYAALKVAASTEGILRQGFNEVNSMKLTQVLYQELDIGAVAITDPGEIAGPLPGVGDDHHLPGKPISSTYTLKAIETGEVVYADGNEVPYRCSLHPQCKLGSALVIPLRGENRRVMGTIDVSKPKPFIPDSINRTLGEVTQLLSAQILAGQYERQKAMLLVEINLRMKLNPHFCLLTATPH